MDKCIVCEHWLQLPHNGEYICLATKDENGMAMVIPPTGEIPEWESCPCGKQGHEKGTSIGYSIGECKDYSPKSH